jgi:hypothetical protein
MSTPVDSSETAGRSRPCWRLTNATSVPIDGGVPPSCSIAPADQYSRAGMAAMIMPMVDMRQRPAMLARTSRPTSCSDSAAKVRVSASARPMVRPSRMPLTDSDSVTMAAIAAICFCRCVVIRFRSRPTRRAIQTKHGSSASDTRVSRQSSASIATTVATTAVRLETSEVAVEVTVACMEPMSLAMRDCTSPVRVLVKNASGICWSLA